jgi:pullulanase
VRKDSGEYEVQVRLMKGSRVEYKITRGSWETVEKGSNQEELTNRVLTATSDQTIAIRVETWRDQLNKR